jgi:enoyl-CoA hydratase/carnithine racemase
MSYNTLSHVISDNILTITLNRPEQLNAFTVEMCEELIRAFDSASADDEVRAIIVTGSGRAFCAGMDLSREGNVFGLDESIEPTLEDMTTRYNDPDIIAGVRDTGGRVALSIYRCTKPVIAAINGTAAGAGFSLAIAGDFAISADTAKYTLAYTGAGLSPDGSSSYVLPRLIGMRKAMELMITNRVLNAEQALDWGLVSEVVPAADVMTRADELAAQLAQGPSTAYGQVKNLLMNSFQNGYETQLQLETDGIAKMAATADGREGIAAFLEKRKPNFIGK